MDGSLSYFLVLRFLSDLASLCWTARCFPRQTKPRVSTEQRCLFLQLFSWQIPKFQLMQQVELGLTGAGLSLLLFLSSLSVSSLSHPSLSAIILLVGHLAARLSNLVSVIQFPVHSIA